MPGTLENKVALVTGGGSGIGRASALTFAREGARVVVADVNIEMGAETVEMIEAADGQATFVRTDVSRSDQVEAMVAETVEVYGGLDCAFNNAGDSTAHLGALVPTHEYPEENWDRVIAVGLKGVWLCMKYEIPEMLKGGGGTIVNMASIFGLVGDKNKAGYVASKHGVVGLTRAAALEYATRNIRVNVICPGFTRTPLTEGRLSDPEIEAQTSAKHPIGRVGEPEEIAEAVVWLCSDAASFVTGHTMAVDGGWVAQ